MTTAVATTARTGANDRTHRAGIVLRAIVAIVLGCLALTYRTYSTLIVAAFALFAIVDGIARIVVAARSTRADRAWLIHALEGLVSIGFGIAVVRIAHSLISLTWTVAEWAAGIGALSIVFSVVAWKRLRDAWLWLLTGLLAVALAAALLWVTFGGLLAPGIALGVFALLYGVLSLVIGLRSRDA